MTQVAQSSSDVGSLVGAGTPTVFDISTESGLLAVLRAIHRSALQQEVKNDLRDVLFAVTKDDAAAHATAVSVLAAAGFTAMYGASVKPRIQSQLGRSRMQPRFAPVAITPTASVRPTVPVPPVSVPVPPVAAPAPTPIPVAPAAVITEPVVAVLETPIPVTTAAPIPPVVSEVVPPVMAFVAPAPQPTPTPTPTPVAVTPPVSSPAPTASTDPMERIKQIKHIVNEKVGNPITLIDTDNRVGREYMNSLLSAMKAANGGRPEDVTAAMDRLEKAFVAAITVAETTPAPETLTDKFVNATVTSASTATSGFDTPAQPEVPAQAPTPTPIETTVAAPEPIADVYPVKINVASPLTAEPISLAKQIPVTPVESAPIPVVSKLSAMSAAINNPIIDPAQAKTPPVAQSLAGPADSSSRLMSVAKEEQLENIMRQKQLEEAQRKLGAETGPISTDPLLAPEVTAGLKQLLSEWSLFKSSGFFGTGPGGADHPLYKRMALLTMAAVIAGRFEGATPQVKQSITDYMNGWRYEEGIVHEHTESFEHYLRRVIRHVLDTKAKK